MKHIVALSGGKDSTAMALRLAEFEPRDYEFVCTPTGNELPEMIAHWEKCEQLLGSTIKKLAPMTLEALIDFYGALPAHHSRWCTRVLKIQPFIAYAKEVSPATSYVGLRADEPDRLGAVYDPVLEVTADFPMKRWGWDIEHVRSYLFQRGVIVPKRTDCAWCYEQRISEWFVLWRDYPLIYAKGIEVEDRISAKRGFPCSFRSPSRDTWPASMRDLAEEFKKGRPIRGMDNKKGEICRACRL